VLFKFFQLIHYKKIRLKNNEIVLDVGCGTGIASLLAAEIVGIKGKVIGIDISENMLNLAKKKIIPQNAAFPQWISGSAEDLVSKIPKNSIDVILCQQVIQFVTNPLKVFQDIYLCLKPGGRMVMCCWVPNITIMNGYYPIYKAMKELQLLDDIPHVELPFRWRGGPDKLADLAHQVGLQVNTLETVPVHLFFPAIENILTRFLLNTKSKLNQNEYEVVTQKLRNLTKNEYDPLTDKDGLVHHTMYSYFLTATRPLTSSL